MEIEQSGREMQVDTVQQTQQIIEEIKNQIREGKLSARTQLPTESTLSKQFNVSRTVARKALQILAQDFLVPADELRNYGSFIKAMQARGYQPEVRFLESPALIAAFAEVADHLHLSTDQLVLKRYSLQLADRVPFRLIESYYPADLFGELLLIDIGEQPLFHWLKEHHGLKAEKVQEKLKARLANDYESSLLDISSNALVIGLERTVWADNGRIIAWAIITAVADRYIFTYKYDID